MAVMIVPRPLNSYNKRSWTTAGLECRAIRPKWSGCCSRPGVSPGRRGGASPSPYLWGGQMTVATRPGDTKTSLDVLRRLLAGYQRDFTVRFWDGTDWAPDGDGPSRFTLVLNHPGSLRAMLANPWDLQLSLAEAFLYEDVDIEGDLEAVFGFADFLLKERPWGLREKLWAARAVTSLPRSAAPRGGRGRASLSGRRDSANRLAEAVHYHYDLNSDFYGL